MVRKSHSKAKFASVAEACEALNLTDQAAADLVGMDRSRMTRIKGGEKFKCLTVPLRISKKLRVPIENLAPADAA
jgi:transcriptional regulator with XRE-family HTH domain